MLGQLCDKACDKILNSPIVKWLVKMAQVLMCVLVVQTGALLWIASSLRSSTF